MIKIISVGKIKEKFFEAAIKEYVKRLSKYSKVELIEVADENSKDISKDLTKEKERILKYIKEKEYVIALDIKGNQLNSTDFANKMNNLLIDNSNIVFIIGGSHGLHKDIINISNYKLSFSNLTFPHQLFRIILLEQIYRAFKIIKNEAYHK